MTEVMLIRHVVPFDTYTEYKQRFLSSTSTTAAFGDSHVARGLISNVRNFDNFGQPSDNLWSIISKIEHRLVRTDLTQIIIQADPQMFAPYRLKSDQGERFANLLRTDAPPLVLLQPEYRQYLMQYWKSSLSNPMLIFRDPAPPTTAVTAFDQKPKDEQAHEATLRVQLHTPIPDAISSDTAQTYRNLVRRLTSSGIRVCLVSFPVPTAYRKAASSVSSFSQALLFFRDTALTTNATYIDYSAAMPDSAFSDPDHLSPNAAARFTEMVLKHCFPDEPESPQ